MGYKSCPHRCPFQGASAHSCEESDTIGGFVFVYGKDVFEAVVYYACLKQLPLPAKNKVIGATVHGEGAASLEGDKCVMEQNHLFPGCEEDGQPKFRLLCLYRQAVKL